MNNKHAPTTRGVTNFEGKNKCMFFESEDKHMTKKIIACLLAVATMLCMVIPASASVDLTKHTFKAYQVFTGDVNDKDELENIAWADGYNADGLLAYLGLTGADATAAAAAKKMAETATADQDALAKAVYDNKGTSAAIEGIGSITFEATGYYVIEDTTNVSDKVDAKNLTLLKVAEADETVTPTTKTDVPSFEKKVKDTNDSTGETTGWQDSADYDIGDTIPYKLTAKLGDISKFDHYYLEFNDTMTHLTLVEGSVQVKIGGEDGTVLTAGQYDVTWNATTKVLNVAITDVKALGATSNSEVVVLYNATLDSDAVIGSTGNPNTANLTFSNNPNNTGDGTTKPSDTGKTPDDKNIVFTYKVSVDKVNEKKEPLKGAGFTLYKFDNTKQDYVPVGDEVKGTELTTFAWNGVDDGNYKLVETTTPTGFKTMDPIEFTVSATHDTESDDPKLTKLDGGDLGTGDVDTGAVTATIVNKSGATLPSTGGIGTTIFYIVGGVLMAGAFVLLITKKRMNHDA